MNPSDAIDKSEQNVPSITCVVCSRPRGADKGDYSVCTDPGGKPCVAYLVSSGIEDDQPTIQRLAREVEAWSGTAHDIFVALEAAYTGKTRCGWCNALHTSKAEARAHGPTCEKNPVAQRLRTVIEAVQGVYEAVGIEMNIGDISFALELVLEAARKPIEST